MTIVDFAKHNGVKEICAKNTTLVTQILVKRNLFKLNRKIPTPWSLAMWEESFSGYLFCNRCPVIPRHWTKAELGHAAPIQSA
jgi:hypothetical protein